MSVLLNTRIVQVQTAQNPYKFVSDDSDLGGVSRVHLKSVIVPNTEYNVNSKTAAVDITAADMLPVGDVPLGQYNITEYLAALKIVLDVAAAPNTFLITQNSLTKKLLFVKSGGSQFTIGLESDSARLIGQRAAKTSVVLVLTCDAIPDLSGMRLVVFKSYVLGKWKISSGDTASEKKKSNVLGSNPMTAPFGGVLKVEQTEETLDSHYFSAYKNASAFDISLVDEDDELLELNGTEWILEFEMHIRGNQ